MDHHGVRTSAAGLLRLAGWVTLVVAAIGALTAAGHGPLALPDPLDRTGWARWAADRDPVTMIFAVLRGVTLVAAWYLLLATVIGAVARVARVVRLVEVADVLTLPAVRRFLQACLGVGLATASLATGPQWPGPPERPLVAAAPVPAVPPDWLDIPPPPAADASAPQPISPPAAPARQENATDPRPAPRSRDRRTPDAATWTVKRGEHLWSIATDVLADAMQRTPTEREVAEYWRDLIDANRPRLVDRRNPDLIVPGQSFRLPAPRDSRPQRSRQG